MNGVMLALIYRLKVQISVTFLFRHLWGPEDGRLSPRLGASTGSIHKTAEVLECVLGCRYTRYSSLEG
jgi:hypothetical protein